MEQTKIAAPRRNVVASSLATGHLGPDSQKNLRKNPKFIISFS